MKVLKVIFFIAFILGGIWIVKYVTTPVPGQSVPDLGRDHVSVEQFARTTYNSNPPTSGPHLETWVKPGIYREPQHDGELIHSLEHGYVIISYNCNVHLKTDVKLKMPFDRAQGKQNAKLKTIRPVYAHEEGEEASPGADLELPPEATGSPSTSLRTGAVNESDACKTLVGQLEDLARTKKLFKLIVVSRPSLDTTLALTAWGYIDTFDEFDRARIERFIDYHRDQGPEKTME